MKIGILGTGIVGNTLGGKLAQKGYEIKMGSRDANNEKASEWAKLAGAKASHGTFRDAAEFGDLLFNCTKGDVSLEVLRSAGAQALRGKILIDLANALDFSNGFPPSLSICNTNSLGETIQKEFPDLKVVKTLNTMNCSVMAEAASVPGEHDVFMAGNDPDAKVTVSAILSKDFGWKNIIDLGDITNARATEMLLPIWVRLYGKFGHANFNFHVAK